MWGIIPAAGKGSRIQPLAFSKELLPVYGNLDGSSRRPRAVSDYLVERLVIGGAEKICFVISPGKSDILEYYGASAHAASLCYVVQASPVGLCDAIFCARPVIGQDETVMVGLPDTIWFPDDGLRHLTEAVLSFLLFPVENPEHFDAVILDGEGKVREIRVKHPEPSTNWVWGAFKMPGPVFHELFELWTERGQTDEYIGTLVNAWLEQGNIAYGIRCGVSYVDVGTMDGYMRSMQMLSETAVTR